MRSYSPGMLSDTVRALRLATNRLLTECLENSSGVNLEQLGHRYAHVEAVEREIRAQLTERLGASSSFSPAFLDCVRTKSQEIVESLTADHETWDQVATGHLIDEAVGDLEVVYVNLPKTEA